jgi:predicted lipid-binding transport protein (Tim44 family)
MVYNARISTQFLPATWYGRLFAALIAVALAVIAVFFVAFALIAGMTVAALIAGRLWWLRRKLRARQDEGIIEGSYTVESAQVLTVQPDGADSNHSSSAPKSRE